ncbi:nicotinamide riboside transporter PnuC [Bulleidia sp. zg-1006]|uniref:nicotinamide riboside transporter PnuC n=1 Tax=Bulleidia sp. zg-1006 TaxID=2806552 RepID=UPI001939B639|nr:nicotinamide riboside transporter PnuC [Bulleidia sp. zg-1006]QRG86913.1 nicotinamide mononucleotide transporter [Bulleidia sp. zg-1006]
MKKIKIDFSKKMIKIATLIFALLMLGAIVSGGMGYQKLNAKVGETKYVGQLEMTRDKESEDFSEDATVFDVVYRQGEQKMIVNYSKEEYDHLKKDTIQAHQYKSQDGTNLFFTEKNPNLEKIQATYKEKMAEKTMFFFNLCSALTILSISLLIMIVFGQMFTTYEKSWFLSIMVLATIVAIVSPSESANGVNGIIIMWLYLMDTFLNILCELLISKQSKYNFLVSIAVELVEIAISLVLMYRFASMVVTLLFWIPIDILSFINWSKHEDREDEDLTIVRRLTGWQEVLVISGIVVFTVVVGYFISGLDIQTDFVMNRTVATWLAYLDACATAVGIANGLFIFFRFREQWLAWFISAILEATMNIMLGQYVLLVLKLGYLTNSTYGYIKWTKYIKSHKEERLTVF